MKEKTLKIYAFFFFYKVLSIAPFRPFQTDLAMVKNYISCTKTN